MQRESLLDRWPDLTGTLDGWCPQGALDGGLDIPHNEKRMVGYDKGKKQLDTDTLRNYIYGGHVSEYMETMQEEEPEKYAAHFSKFSEAGLEPEEMEDTITKVGGERCAAGAQLATCLRCVPACAQRAPFPGLPPPWPQPWPWPWGGP